MKSISRSLSLAVLSFVYIAFSSPLQAVAQVNETVKAKSLPPVHWIRSRDYDMRHVALNLKFDWEKELAYGTSTLTLSSLIPNLQQIDLDAGGMKIGSVQANGRALRFDYDLKASRLSVKLDKSLSIGELVTIVVEYSTTGYVVENTLGFGGGGGLKFIKPTPNAPNRRRQIWSQGESDYNRFWFPAYDSPNDFRTSELIATVEKPMTVISNGSLIEKRDNGDGTQTFHWKMDIPYANYLTSIVVGEYAEIKGEYDGIPVLSYVFPNELREGTATTRRLPEMVKFFSEITGLRYPYPKYAQTMAEGFSGGMENISATTMTPEMILDERELANGDKEDPESLQSHELAHQWFGDYVTTREWSDIWLNESFATYFQAMWDEHSKGKDYFLFNDVVANQEAYYGSWAEGQRRPIVTKYYENADALFDTYAYPRGGAVLHMLRKHLGDALFFKGIKHYLESNANKPVQTEQLRIAFEEATGQSMDWFFDQWLYKMGHPVFVVTKKYDAASKQLVLTVRQSAAKDDASGYPQVEFFQTYVDVAVDGKVSRLWIEPKETNVFSIKVQDDPKLVNFDYEGTLIKELDFKKSTDELIYQFKNDADVLGRRWAMNELLAIDGPDAPRARAAVVVGLRSEKFAGLRREGLDSISAPSGGSFKPEQQIADALKTFSSDEDSGVRSLAMSRLGLMNDVANAPLFISNLSAESYRVVDAAAAGLGRLKDPKYYPMLEKLARTDGWKDNIRVSGLKALALLGARRAMPIGIEYSNPKFSTAVRNAAAQILASSGKGDNSSFQILMQNFKDAIEEGNQWNIFKSLRNLATFGDVRAEGAFKTAKDKFKSDAQFLEALTRVEADFVKALKK